MFAPVCMIEGKSIADVKEDFRSAKRVEQYRIGRKALYLPEGLKWKYLPLTEIRQADESFRVVNAGHCVAVREKRPELDLETEGGKIHLQLEKPESMRAILDALRAV